MSAAVLAPHITEGWQSSNKSGATLLGRLATSRHMRADLSALCDTPFSSYVFASPGLASNLLPDMEGKPSRGAGQSPAESARCAAGSPLLDSLENNRHTNRAIPEYYKRPEGRGRHCGRFSIRGTDASGKTIVRRVHCKSWTCSYCGPRRAALSKRRICETAEKLNLNYFWTLTLPAWLAPEPITAVRRIRKCFNKLREYLKRVYGSALRFICVLEFTERGVPHLHVLFDRYIDHSWMSETWRNLGAGQVVWVKKVTAFRIARYLSKYLTKDLITSAPRGCRRITTSRDIHLFEKMAAEFPWEFLRQSVWQLFTQYSARFFDIQMPLLNAPLGYRLDTEGFLIAFEVAPESA